ncbi:MAG TPA: TraI domain-containing protein, partial [Pirellulales bacterium]|nr:TraI domain-containing protein [Pirellulales bacterium]
MATRPVAATTLSEMTHGHEADLFALLTVKEELTTRDGKPYFKVGFRDACREVTFPIWADSPWAEDCRRQWTTGVAYKLRAIYRETNYGPQLEIRKIREVVEADKSDGFDPAMFLPQSRFDPTAMFEELLGLARAEIADAALARLVESMLQENRETLLTLPAATRNHHAFAGGFLEHVLSVTRTAIFLAAKYDDYYPDMQPRLNRGLVV